MRFSLGVVATPLFLALIAAPILAQDPPEAPAWEENEELEEFEEFQGASPEELREALEQASPEELREALRAMEEMEARINEMVEGARHWLARVYHRIDDTIVEMHEGLLEGLREGMEAIRQHLRDLEGPPTDEPSTDQAAPEGGSSEEAPPPPEDHSENTPEESTPQ